MLMAKFGMPSEIFACLNHTTILVASTTTYLAKAYSYDYFLTLITIQNCSFGIILGFTSLHFTPGY